MPTPIVSGQKTAFIAIVNAVNPTEAARLQTILVNYEDIPTAIGRQLSEYAGNNEYLQECMACFLPNDADLQVAGIYNNNTFASPLSNPVLILNATVSAGVSVSASYAGIGILGSSSVNSIILNSGYQVDNIYIGPNSSLDVLDSSSSNCSVGTVYLSTIKNIGSRLNIAKVGSIINSVQIDPGSYFGGYKSDDPLATCTAGAVTGLALGVITHNTVELTWTPPVGGGWIFLNVYYKLTDASSYVSATPDDGDFIGNTGFIFRTLLSDTFYDFKVTTVCNNGATSDATLLQKQTNSSTVITQ